MRTVDTIQNGSRGFQESRVSARVYEFGVILSLGLIGIIKGRG